jgi:hypothetical protein
MSYFILSANVFRVAPCCEKRKYEDENRGFKTQWEDVFVFVERNWIRYFVSQTLTLYKVSCPSRVVASPAK